MSNTVFSKYILQNGGCTPYLYVPLKNYEYQHFLQVVSVSVILKVPLVCFISLAYSNKNSIECEPKENNDNPFFVQGFQDSHIICSEMVIDWLRGGYKQRILGHLSLMTKHHSFEAVKVSPGVYSKNK